MKKIEVERMIFGKKVTACVTILDVGIHVLISGGESSHVGTISAAYTEDKKAECDTMVIQEHKERVISEKWAMKIHEEYLCPVTVACGIHYDNATADMIKEIVLVTEEMINEVIGEIRNV